MMSDIMSLLALDETSGVKRFCMLNRLKDVRIYQRVAESLDPEELISYEEYLSLVDAILRCEHHWPPARRIEIRKTFSQKRRIVYNYPTSEMFVLRVLNYYLFRRFKRLISPAYFPSQGRSPSQCLDYLLERLERYSRVNECPTSDLYGLHMDISDYFNSIDPDRLFERLPEELQADEAFRELYKQTIQSNICLLYDGTVAKRRGGMAGFPIAAFFAAIYLSEMDEHIVKLGIPYARYSDDILFFNSDENSLTALNAYLEQFLKDSGLVVNQPKTVKINPGEPWTFIGFEVHNSTVDIAPHAEEKIKRRIGRWARRLRKRVEQGYGRPLRRSSPEKAAAALIRRINRALFKPIKDKYCWARWAFPTINTTKRLEALDVYIQEKIRYVYTGRYSRANYRILPYERLAAMGYKSLMKLYHLYQYRPDDYQAFLDGFAAESPVISPIAQ